LYQDADNPALADNCRALATLHVKATACLDRVSLLLLFP